MTREEIEQQLRTDNPTTTDDASNRHGPGSEIYEAAIQRWADAMENAVLPPPPPVTRRQLKRWLLAQGLLAQVPALIAAITDDNARAEAEIDWEDASVFEVTNPLVVNFATALGLDNEQLHAAWREAALIE